MTAGTIRELNDAFRKTFSGGKVVMTASVAALPETVRANALLEVTRFDAFSPDNDPYGEHDFGSFEMVGRKFFWKIDALYEESEVKSADGQLAVTRVLTLILAVIGDLLSMAPLNVGPISSHRDGVAKLQVSIPDPRPRPCAPAHILVFGRRLPCLHAIIYIHVSRVGSHERGPIYYSASFSHQSSRPRSSHRRRGKLVKLTVKTSTLRLPGSVPPR